MDLPTEKQAVASVGKWHFDAHHRFFTACVFAGGFFFGTAGPAAFTTRLVATWDVYAFATVVIAWFTLATQDPYEVRRNARLQDASRTFLFVVVISAATISLFAVFILLGSAKDLPPSGFATHVILSVAAIVLSW